MLETAWSEDWDTVDVNSEACLDAASRLMLAALIHQTGVSQAVLG